jgi:hypothetical protein
MSTLVMLAIGAGTALAQAPDGPPLATTPVAPAENPQRVREARYQIGQMERVLEGAVEHGASEIRDRLAALMPADMLLTDNARARGFRLDGYGVFFDVEVPSLAGTLVWSLRTLDQNDLGLDAALATLRSYVQQAGAKDVNVQQALKRVELQVAPMRAALSPSPGTPPEVPDSQADQPVRVDPVFNNPDEAYRAQIRDALVDAMLEHSRGLGVGADEWLTVAARRSDDRSGVAPIDTDARTMVLRVRGADLTAFLGGQLSREDARKRIEVRVF